MSALYHRTDNCMVCLLGRTQGGLVQGSSSGGPVSLSTTYSCPPLLLPSFFQQTVGLPAEVRCVLSVVQFELFLWWSAMPSNHSLRLCAVHYSKIRL